MQHQDVVIGSMNEEFILWRCLHDGPQSKETVDLWPPDNPRGWSGHRAINLPLLEKPIPTYGTCAILATYGAQVVGFLRFHPKVLFSLEGAGLMCLQQGFPAGPSEHLINQRFPPSTRFETRPIALTAS